MTPERAPLRENELAEQVADASGAEIRYQGNQAYYEHGTEHIYMPPRHCFKASAHATAGENFYATLLHELVHWTSAKARCNRDRLTGDATQAYAFEELVAELGAAVLNTRFHKLPEPRKDHAAYLASWLSALREDISYIYKALGLAQQAADWLCARAGITLQEREWRPNQSGGDAEWKQEAPAEPKASPGPVIAAMYEVLGKEVTGFLVHQRVRVVCGQCAELFQVTLHRSDIGSYCPECGRFNLLEG